MSREAWGRYQKGGSWQYDIAVPGYKYNMSDLQAAIGLCQLKKLPGFIRRRKEIAEAYTSAFAGNSLLELPQTRPSIKHAWHLYVVRLQTDFMSIDRDQFIEELASRNIGTSVHFIPIHLHSYYSNKYGYRPENFPVAYQNYLRMLSLPLNPAMTNRDVADVIEAVEEVVCKHQCTKRAA